MTEKTGNGIIEKAEKVKKEGKIIPCVAKTVEEKRTTANLIQQEIMARKQNG